MDKQTSYHVTKTCLINLNSKSSVARLKQQILITGHVVFVMVEGERCIHLIEDHGRSEMAVQGLCAN